MKGRDFLFSGKGQSGSKEEAVKLGTLSTTKNSSGAFSGRDHLCCLLSLLISGPGTP